MPGRDNKELDQAMPGGTNQALTVTQGNTGAEFIQEAYNTFTVEMWVKPTSEHEIDDPSNMYGGINNQKYIIGSYWMVPERWEHGKALMALSVGTNGVSVYENALDYFPALLAWEGDVTDWTHIAVVYDNKVKKLYINGEYVMTGAASWVDTVYCGTMIASAGTTIETMDGEMDEVRIWNYAKTPEQILASMNTTVPTPQQGLVAYWPVNQSDADSMILRDISGYGYNVTLPSSYDSTKWINSTSPVGSYREGYRYGFNGQEHSNELQENGYTAEFWEYDARLGRRWNVDPVFKDYESPYSCFVNNPILLNDPLGDDPEKGKLNRSVRKYRRKFEKTLKGIGDNNATNREAAHKKMEIKYNRKRWMWIKDDDKMDLGGSRNMNHSIYYHAGDQYRASVGDRRPTAPTGSSPTGLSLVGNNIYRNDNGNFTQMRTYAIPRGAAGSAIEISVTASGGSITATVDQGNRLFPNQTEVTTALSDISTTVSATVTVPNGSTVSMCISPVNTRLGNFIYLSLTTASSDDLAQNGGVGLISPDANVSMIPPPPPPRLRPITNQALDKYSPSRKLIHNSKHLNKETIKDLNKYRNDQKRQYKEQVYE